MSPTNKYLKFTIRILAFILSVITFPYCIKPYSPALPDVESLIVINGLLTDENTTSEVNIYKTIRNSGTSGEKVTGATVVISDEKHNFAHLTESAPGVYRSDSLRFRGQQGRTYTLHINLPDGREYESTPCTLYPAPSFDSVFFIKDLHSVPGSAVDYPGVSIMDASQADRSGGYYRWSYDECWKISVLNPATWNFINDSTILPISDPKETCWKYNSSDEIITGSQNDNSATKGTSRIFFFPSETSDRLRVRYSVLVKKMSISREEYEFWNHLKLVSESGGDIFDKQPFPVSGNIRNVNNPGEPVLGFFHVSGVKSKRLYITKDWALDNDLPLYKLDCEMVAKGIADYPPPLSPGGGIWWDDIYNIYTAAGFTFTEPLYNQNRELEKLVFVKTECADCTVQGTLNKPSFWTD